MSVQDHAAVTVRAAVADDAASIAGLVAALEGSGARVGEVARRLERLLDDQDAGVLVAERSGAVIGWGHVFVAHRLQVATFAELGGLVVAPEQQRRGVGTALLAASEAWARGRGVGEMRIRSRVERDGAHAFYAARGFEARKRQTVFVRPLG